MLPRYGMIHRRFQPFHNGHWQYARAASIGITPLYVGIARVCGMTSVTVPHRADIVDDFGEKLGAAETLFQQGCEFVHLHAKGPDVAAHQKDPCGKLQAIEALHSTLADLVKRVEREDDLLVVVTGDHVTPSRGPLIHLGEAVPLLIAGGPNVLSDQSREFHERAVITGGLGRVYGVDLMPILLNLTDRV